MKVAIAVICLAVLLIGVNPASHNFDFGGMTGVVDAMSIVNGEKNESEVKSIKKVEELLKSMIHKHLANKKELKKHARKQAEAQEVAPNPINEQTQLTEAQLDTISNIKWDEHPETRDVLNQKIHGGTEAVDALVKLFKERNVQK